MARQVLYTANDIDQILPRDEQERRVLAAAVKHGLLTPMAWDTPPTHFGRNPATFAELCAFAADVSGLQEVPPLREASSDCTYCDGHCPSPDGCERAERLAAGTGGNDGC